MCFKKWIKSRYWFSKPYHLVQVILKPMRPGGECPISSSYEPRPRNSKEGLAKAGQHICEVLGGRPRQALKVINKILKSILKETGSHCK